MNSSGSSTLGGNRTSAAVASLARRSRRDIREPLPSSALVWILIAFLAIDYLRPPLLQAAHLQMLFVALMPLVWLFSKNRPWSTNLTLQALVLVTGAMMLPFARNNFQVYVNTNVMYANFVAALVMTWLMQYRRYFQRVLWSLILIMCVQAVYAMTHHGRGHGDLVRDENDLAIACTIFFPLGFVGIQTLTGRLRWICAGVMVLLLGGIAASFSRGGFVGLVAAVVYCVLLGRHRIRNLTIGGAGAALLFLLAPSGYSDEMASISQTDTGTAETRFFLWLAAANVWTNYPIFGVGPYNTSGYVGEYQPRTEIAGMFKAKEFKDRDWTGKAIHSLYFEVLADRGVVGVGLFTAIAVLHFRTLRRLRRAADRGVLQGADLRREARFYSLSLEASMVGFLAAGTFLSVAAYPHFWYLSAQTVALDRWVRREHKRRVAGARIAGSEATAGAGTDSATRARRR